MDYICNNSNDNKKTDETTENFEKKVENKVENKVRECLTKDTNTSTTDLNKTYVIIDKKKENNDDNKKTDDKPDSKISNDEINECSYYMLGEWLQKNQ
tara:strand:- start:46 stop:339 length:294 start_codon:yes stop_codon:yes gene_type:complete